MKAVNSIYFKIISWFLVLSFVFVFILNDYSYASRYVAQKLEQDRRQGIELPFEYGQVVERYDSSSAKYPKVVLIQDLHANYEVQKNIKNILQHIDDNHGLSKIGVEGNSKDVDVSLLASIPKDSVKESVIDYFMKKGFCKRS